ncbi:hypothetical protein ACP6L2_05055 [Sphingobacterium lactis]|uniref:hypothetical protein n=1 Tax=Sphingobacterium lactis TaxID=797291 RepID=UPI003F815878
MRIVKLCWSLFIVLIPLVSQSQEIRLVKDSLLTVWRLESGKINTSPEYNKNLVNSLSKEIFKHVDSFFKGKDYRINNSIQVNQRLLVFELIKDSVSSDSLQVLAYNIAFIDKLGEVKGLDTQKFVKLKQGPSKMPVTRYLAKDKYENLILLEINNGLVLDEAEYERKKQLLGLVFKWMLK